MKISIDYESDNRNFMAALLHIAHRIGDHEDGGQHNQSDDDAPDDIFGLFFLLGLALLHFCLMFVVHYDYVFIVIDLLSAKIIKVALKSPNYIAKIVLQRNKYNDFWKIVCLLPRIWAISL